MNIHRSQTALRSVEDDEQEERWIRDIESGQCLLCIDISTGLSAEDGKVTCACPSRESS